MRKVQRVVAAVLVAVGGMGGVAGPCGASVGVIGEVGDAAVMAADERNAALYYWRAFYSLDREFQQKSGELLAADRSADWAPADDAVAKLNENSAFIEQLLKASRVEGCNFGIAYEDGFLALLPHLGLMMSSGRIMVLDAHRLMVEGKPDATAERVAVIYRMAGHVRNDGVMISSLVSGALASMAGDAAAMFANAGKFTEAGRQNILAAMQPLEGADGLKVREAFVTERRMVLGYLREKLKGPLPGKRLLEIVDGDQDEALVAEILAMDEASIQQQLQRMDGLYEAILKAWDTPAHDEELKKINQEIEAGKHGVLAKLLMPSTSNIRSSETRAKEKIVKTKETLTAARVREPSNEPAPTTEKPKLLIKPTGGAK